MARARPGLGALSTSSSPLTLSGGQKAVRKGGERAWGTLRGQEGLPSLGTHSSQLMGSSGCFSSSVSARTCPRDSTLRAGKYFPNVQDFSLAFEAWSAAPSVNSPKRGFTSLKSHWGGDVMLASLVYRSWAPYSCQEAFRICKEIRRMESDAGWAIPCTDSQRI